METDADLARATGWSKATVSRILNDKLQGVSKVKLKQLAKVLGCSEADLVELENVAQTPFQREVMVRVKAADHDAQQMLKLVLKIPDSVPLDS